MTNINSFSLIAMIFFYLEIVTFVTRLRQFKGKQLKYNYWSQSVIKLVQHFQSIGPCEVSSAVSWKNNWCENILDNKVCSWQYRPLFSSLKIYPVNTALYICDLGPMFVQHSPRARSSNWQTWSSVLSGWKSTDEAKRFY